MCRLSYKIWNVINEKIMKNKSKQNHIPKEHIPGEGLKFGAYFLLKRIGDIIFSFTSLLLCAPLFLIISILIKLDSPGPVFSYQIRVGKNGRLFKLIKFRTMKISVDERLHDNFLQSLFSEGSSSSKNKIIWALENDPRITKIGRLLRKTSLDELPQFVNVLKGDMSFIGPRPALPYEVERYEPWQKERLKCTPGITGPWINLYDKGKVDFNEMILMDIEYTKNRSILLDIKVFWKTISIAVKGQNTW